MIIDGNSQTSPSPPPPPPSSTSSSSQAKIHSQMINVCLLFGVVSILLVQSNQHVSSSSSNQSPPPPTANPRKARQQLASLRAAAAATTNSSSSQQQYPPEAPLSGRSELEVAQLIVFKFHDAFEQRDNKQQEQQANQTIDDQAPLETRKIDTGLAGDPLVAAAARNQLNDRNYFKILNRVFSRVALPDLYKSSRNPSRGLHCGPHIGCIEEIPNFPSLLKRPNISSSFTIYTPSNPKTGKKILFEPIVHHQLQDHNHQHSSSNNNNDQQQSEQSSASATTDDKKPPPTADQQSNRAAQQTAASWRSASRIVSSQEYPFDLAALEQSGFDSSLNTRIIVGGYFAKEDEEWIDEIVKQWSLLEPSSNIIKVSWADANRGLYHTAAYNSRIVGRQLTLFLHYLDQLFHIDLNRFHLVGHSLGAHIAGFVGADNDGKIARITGLDPAGPIFVELNTSMRLDPNDAQFVDVMHTNGGTITKGALGLSTPSGHVDYYCNGGSIQPGCYFSSVTKSMMDPVERVACSHRRSYRYFTELIKLAINENALIYSSPSVAADVNNEYLTTLNNSSTTTTTMSPSEILSISDNLLARRLHHDEDMSTSQQHSSKQPQLSNRFPRAFLFEARQEDLVRLSQPEIVIMSRGLGRSREMSSHDSLLPLKRHLEFHEMRPNFPAGKRGMYFFKTRSESPFFASKQYALTLRTDQVIRRKMTLMARVDQTLVAEVEADEIPGLYTIAFVPNDPKLFDFGPRSAPAGKIPQVSLMWRYRSFNLLLNQQNELPLIGLELSLLDSESDQAPVLIKYGSASFLGPLTSVVSGVSGGSSLPTAVFRGISGASQGANFFNMSPPHMSLTRNQWHRFEGKLVSRSAL